MDRTTFLAPVAIVGIGCRFPGAASLEEYRRLLLEGRCAIEEAPAARFNQARFYDPEPGAYGKSYTKIGGWISDSGFDRKGFRLPPQLLESVDGLQLMALEVARTTFEHAGLETAALDGRNVAVVLGHSRGSMVSGDVGFATAIEGLLHGLEQLPAFEDLPLARREQIRRAAVDLIHKRYTHWSPDGGPVVQTSALAGLISSVYGLTGRHMVVDAACASSFAALEIAVRALRQGSVDLALSGGASYTQEAAMILFSQARAVSADGSYPFDERANGFVSCDGLGMVLLQRLDDALRDGRKIYGLIRGIGGSCDGKGKGLWAPRKEGQVLAIERAYRHSGVDPGEIGMLEAHATGTSLGDATEVEALTEFFGPRVQRGTKIPIGSVKSNIGHGREAAGIASLIKVLLAFDSEVIPPSIGYSRPSPKIQWDETPLSHATRPVAWPRGERIRFAGADAFGIGGLNYHVVVEEAPTAERARDLVERMVAPAAPEPIAVVGLGCVLPGARTPEELWARLCAGETSIREAPATRWAAEVYVQRGEPSTWRTYTARGGFIEGYTPDWRRYRIPPKLVEGTDPMQFMLLDAAMDALSDAKLDLDKADRKRISTTVGSAFGSDYAFDLTLAMRVPEVIEALCEVLHAEGLRDLAPAAAAELESRLRGCLPTITEDSSGSSSYSTLGSRVAKALDLQGATFAVDAAGASSLASLEIACESLWARDCDVALHAGGDRSMRVQKFEAASQPQALSRKGHSAPFDAAADGYLPGEGAGVCVLKRLGDAEAAGDRIYAVIRGIGSSSDGERKGLLTPSSAGLATAMRRAYASAGVDPRTIGFVECHGLGTAESDAAEAAALRDVLCAEGRSEKLLIGSIKSNIGHTQGAAGVAAMIKASLALGHGTLPPTAGVRTASAALGDWIEVAKQSRTLSEVGGVRRAAVTAMGDLGINYHVVLERPADLRPEPVDAELCFLFPGQGSQYPGMMREVAKDFPKSAAVLEEIDRVLTGAGERKLSTVLWERPELMSEVLWTQLAVLGGDLMMLEAARDRGLNPVLVTGHSYGEYPALVAAGALTVEQAVRATLLRCEAIAAVDRPGAMASVFAGRAKLDSLLKGLPGYAAPSNINSPEQIVVSGDPSAIDALLQRCQKEGVAAVKLPVPRAFHSELMRPAQERLKHEIGQVELREPRGRFLSSVGAKERSTIEELRQALIEQMTQPVDFVTQVNRAYEAGCRKFVEVGPGNVLTKLAGKILNGKTVRVVALDDRKKPGSAAIDKALTSLKEPQAKDIAEASSSPPALLQQAEAKTDRELQAPRSAPPIGHSAAASGAPALFTAEEWRVVADNPRWPAFWASARPALVNLARDLFEGFELAKPATGRPTEPAAIKVLDATERRRQRIAQQLQDGTLKLPRRSTPTAASPAAAAEEKPVPARIAPPAAGPSVEVEEVRAFLLEAVTQQTGYPADLIDFELDLEADLGIDTVKQAQVLGKARERFDLAADTNLSLRDFPTLGHVQRYVMDKLQGKLGEELAVGAAPAQGPVLGASVVVPAQSGPSQTELTLAALAPATSGPAQSASSHRGAAAGVPQREVVETQLIELVCEQSGYPAELIGLDLDLEADLGIDTVKQAQVLGKVREIYDLKADTSLSLRDFPTLRHVADHVLHSLATSVAPAAAAVAEPVVVQAAQTQPEAAAPVGRPVAATVKAAPEEALEETTKRITLPQPTLLGQLPMLRLEGTAFDMGLQHGLMRREAIGSILEAYKSFVGSGGLGRDVLQNALARPEQYFDKTALDEVRGIAEGAGLPYRHILGYNLDSSLFPEYGAGCTQLGLAPEVHRAGFEGVVHAVNEDSPLLLHLGDALERVVQVRRPKGGRPHVLFSLAGQIGGPNGISSTGLAVTSCVLLDRSASGSHSSGLLHPVLVRRLVEEADSVAEAMSMARQSQRTGSWSLLVSHASETRLGCFEYDGPEQWEQLDLGRHLSSNHALLAPRRGEVPEHSRHRLERIEELIGARTEDGVDQETVQHMLRDRFDRGRGREASHRTMNTVCRVDNVMGLVVDSAARKFRVTDRIGRGTEEPNWEEVRLEELFREAESGQAGVTPEFEGAPAEARAAEGVRRVELRGLPGEASEPRGDFRLRSPLMTRYVVRTEVEDLKGPLETPYRPARILIVGEGGIATELARRLSARGSEVETVELDADPEVLLRRAAPALERGAVPDLCLLSGLARSAKSAAGVLELSPNWPAERRRLLEGPYQLVQAWLKKAPSPATGLTLSGITGLGGGLGHENASLGLPEGGGVAGLFKALRREFSGLRVKLLDIDPSEKPEEAATALLAELDAADPRLEAGLLRGQRRVVRLLPAQPVLDPGRLEELRGFRSVLLTGGARGITAAVARHLARSGVRRLNLLGRTPLAPEVEEWRELDESGLQRLRHGVLERLRGKGGKVTPVEWELALEPIHKSLEIDQTLRQLASAGAETRYHCVDVGDRIALSVVLEEIRRVDGPIEAVIHGAGVERSRGFLGKPLTDLRSTLNAKVDGALHLLSLTAQDPLRLFVAFSSVSGRFGGLGQADYSLASEVLVRMTGAAATARPECRFVAIDWPAWDEVGMAAKTGTRALLHASGQKFLHPEEGGTHFLREVLARDGEPEVLFAEQLVELDLDRLLPDPASLARRQSVLGEAARMPLVDVVLAHGPDRVLTECRLDASRDPFLLEHRIGPMPIVPSVVGLELMAETAQLASGGRPLAALESVVIETALKLAPGRRLPMRCEARPGEGDAVELVLRTDFVGRGERILDPDRTLCAGRARYGGIEAATPAPKLEEVDRLFPYQYLDTWDEDPKSVWVYHGPPFRGLVEVSIGRGTRHEAKILAPPASELRPERAGANWWLPAPLVDCCLQACGVVGRLTLSTFALPGSFGRVRVFREPRPGEPCVAQIQKTSHEERRIHFDILLLGEDGAPVLALDNYVSHTFTPIPS